MKICLLFLFCCGSILGKAQQPNFEVINLSLPPEIAFADNQFSGLYIQHNNLYLLSESRFQDNAEAKIYAISLAELNKKFIDTSYQLSYKKLPIYNLTFLKDKMKVNGDEYEGLEAIVVYKNEVYLSVETATPSNNCYMLKGFINDTAIILNDELLSLPKPINTDGKHIYNAGYEAMFLQKKIIYPLFEYNYFGEQIAINTVYKNSLKMVDANSLPVIKKIPFRLTDITQTHKNKYTAINYFYKGTGNDEVYRLPPNDPNNKYIKDSSGYNNYTRLIQIKKHKNTFSYKPVWAFPKAYMGYNWEGIAAYKNGYFIVNDKYTPARPYQSVLIYLKPKK